MKKLTLLIFSSLLLPSLVFGATHINFYMSDGLHSEYKRTHVYRNTFNAKHSEAGVMCYFDAMEWDESEGGVFNIDPNWHHCVRIDTTQGANGECSVTAEPSGESNTFRMTFYPKGSSIPKNLQRIAGDCEAPKA